MKTALLVAAVVALVAAAAWALSASRPASTSYTVEVRDVAGAPGLTVVPEVVAAAPRSLVMHEVVSRANQMPEVTVSARRSTAEQGPMRPSQRSDVRS